MKRLFAFVTLMFIVFGLSAQEVAFAAVPVGQPAASVMLDSSDCDTMGVAKNDATGPCKGITADCIAKMGCALPLAIVPPPASGMLRPSSALAPPVTISPVLANRIVGPEPEPPTHLA